MSSGKETRDWDVVDIEVERHHTPLKMTRLSSSSLARLSGDPTRQPSYDLR